MFRSNQDRLTVGTRPATDGGASLRERESKARQAKYRADSMEQEIRERRLHTELPQRLRDCNYDTQLIDEVVSIMREILGDSS